VSRALEGTLSEVGLCDLLRLIAREKRTGTLRVTVDGNGWSFALDDGRLVGVRCDDDSERPAIEPTVLALVRHRRGTFRLEPAGAGAPVGEGDVPAAGVQAEELAELGDRELERLDERIAAMGGDSGHPRRDRFPRAEELSMLDPDARAVFALVNDERSLAELIVRSGLDPRRALDALDGLVADSLVALPAAEARAGDRGGAGAFRAADVWRDGLAALLPLVLLLAWLGVSGGGSGAAAPADPFAIRHDPLAAARAAHEVERLRAAIEAHRFAEGRLPERLHTLVQGGYVPMAALTDARGRQYYYARRDDGFVLLAPER